jgi:zinc finger protein 830
MADVRALLKAKRQEARITHPLASYNQAGQLRCVACGSLVKHASAWEGHLGSKAHRTNVARLKAEEKAREEQKLKELQMQEQVARGKRKAEEQSSDSSEESDEAETKRRKVDAGKPKAKSTGFPVDFFSDPSRAPLPPQSDDEEDEETPEDDVSKPPPLAAPPSAIDLEYEKFQRELLNGPDFQETYERATVIVEPELVQESMEGLPEQEGETGQESGLAQKQSEDAVRRQKEQDERELIMDRLLEEERAQEEADMKVTVMKMRREALKKKREAKALNAQTVS